MAVRVLVVDRESQFRMALRAALASSGFDVVAEGSHGRDALRLARRHRPDVAVLDLGAPGLETPDALRDVVRAAPGTHVIALADGVLAHFVDAVCAGALGYVDRAKGAAGVLAALRDVAGGKPHLAPGSVAALAHQHREALAVA